MRSESNYGVAFPLFSLPGKYGVGDIDSLYEFVESIKEGPLKVIQLLPLNALNKSETSPYSSISAFANHSLYLSISKLPFLSKIPEGIKISDRVQYAKCFEIKEACFRNSYEGFLKSADAAFRKGFDRFCKEQSHWLDSYSYFHAILNRHNLGFWDWPEELQSWINLGDKEKEEFHLEAQYFAYLQYLFFLQWKDLKEHCQKYEIRLMGDLPIYVSKNSSDYWASPEMFQKGVHAGVPPDLYSEDGQDWGNPIYDWDLMKKDDYEWWKQRMRWMGQFFDLVRIDHIRGLHGYWAVEDGKKPSATKDWSPGPKDGVILAIQSCGMEIIGEDLGLITKDIEEWMLRLDVPGYRVFLFGWGWYADSDSEDYGSLKYRDMLKYPENTLFCTSTHDSETLQGFLRELHEKHKSELCEYLNLPTDSSIDTVREAILKLSLKSESRYLVHPLQDLIADTERVNSPGTVGEQNWSNVIRWEQEKSKIEWFEQQILELKKSVGQ